MQKTKMIGTSKKYKYGNHRVEFFKVDRDSNIGFVELGCYLDINGYESNGACLRALHSLWNRNNTGFDINGLNLTIEIPELLLSNHTNDYGYCTFCVRFELEGLSRHLDELIYEVIMDKIIDMIDDSKCIVYDK